MQLKRVFILMVMLFFTISVLSAEEDLKTHELGLALNSYYNLQYTDIQNVEVNPGFYYTHHITEDTGFGLQIIPLSFAFVSEKEEIKADNRLFREKLKLNSATFAVYLQKKYTGFLGPEREISVRTGLTYLNPAEIDIMTNENKVLLDDYFSEKPEYSTDLQNYSAAASLLSGYGLFAEASTPIYQKDNFSINAGLSMAILQFTYEYKLRGRIYNDTTTQYEYIDRDETAVVQQGLFTISLLASYKFEISDLKNIFGSTKVVERKNPQEELKVNNLNDDAVGIYQNPVKIDFNSFMIAEGDKLRIIASLKENSQEEIAGGFMNINGEIISMVPIGEGKYKAVKDFNEIEKYGAEEQVKVTVLLASGKTINSEHRIFINKQSGQYQVDQSSQNQDYKVTENASAEDFGLEEL